MSLSDDFAKVQLQAAAATKDLSRQPRLGAVAGEEAPDFRSFLASHAHEGTLDHWGRLDF